MPLYNGAVYVKVLDVGSARNKLFAEEKLAKAISNINKPQQQKSEIKNQSSPQPASNIQEKSKSPQANPIEQRKEKSPVAPDKSV